MVTGSFRTGAVIGVALLSLVGFMVGCAHRSEDSSGTASMETHMINGLDASAKMKSAASAVASPMSPSVAIQRGFMGGPMATGTARLAGLSSQDAVVIPSRKVIRKAELDIRVENVEKAEKAVSAIVQTSGGYTESATSTDLASNHPVMEISLRVPVETFDTSIARFEALGVRLSKTIGSEDVTGRIVDLDAQLKTLTTQAEVYRNMLKGRTQLDEVFNIQQQLTNVQTQIEDITAQRKSQAGLAALSTIKLTLEQNAVISQTPTDPNWLVQSWAGATSSASAALRAVAVFLMWAVAFSPFWIPVGLIVRRVLRGSVKARETFSASH